MSGCQELTVTIPEGALPGEDLEIPVPMVPRSRQAIRFEAKKWPLDGFLLGEMDRNGLETQFLVGFLDLASFKWK